MVTAANRRILLTGSAGYIGQVLAPKLQANGWDVIGCDSGFFDGCNLPVGPIFPTTLTKDVRDVTPADLAGVYGVIHLAGISNDPVGELNPALTLEINYQASVRLAEMARKAGVARFVFSSSCSVYGARSAAPVIETDELEPLTAYASSKILTEQAVSALAGPGFCPVFLRNATVYGLSPRLRFDLVVNNLVGWAHTTGQIRIMSDGSPWRPLIHVEDVSSAFVAALEAPADRVSNQSFNIGRDDANYTVREIATYVKDAMPEAELSFSESPPPDARSYKVDFSKARNFLPEFQPSWDLASGVAQLRDAFRGCSLTAEQFEGPAFTRLKRLLDLQSNGRLTPDLRFGKPLALAGSH
jgi:nucleoside-diphosphate-sugar epimerase